MRYQMKRGISVTLVLVLVISLLSGLTVPARADSYTYNWGKRGVTATRLSDNAKAFYNRNGITYADLASLEGSTSTSAVPDSALYLELQDLMVTNHTFINDYGQSREYFRYTDCQSGGGQISSFYSGAAIGPDWDGGATWNREHTWPNSKGLEGSDEDDIMMLRPTSVSENTSRGNKAYGKSSGYYDPNSESGGKLNLHGDVARITLYVYTRWGNTSRMWGTGGVIESKEVLLQWMKEDPVDTWEMGRNDAVQSVTGTRNVYVDFPELAYLLFGEDIPADLVTPSGNANAGFTITATANDSSMGSVSVSGSNVIATPEDGYMVEGYEILSGDATVTRQGNTFIVNAKSDCTIQINFAPRTKVTVTYLENGIKAGSETVYVGDSVTLPDLAGETPEGYTFLGWSETGVDHATELPAFLKSGASYTVSSDISLHALFSHVTDSDGGSGTWMRVTDASKLAPGIQVIFAYTGHKVVSGALNTGKKILTTVNAEFSDDFSVITSMPASALIFTLGGKPGAWTFANPAGKLLGATSNKTSLTFSGGSTGWDISVSGGDATIQNTQSGRGRIQYNVSYPRFADYTSNQAAPQLYMLDESGTVCYTTGFTHVHKGVYREAVPATCEKDGTVAHYACACGLNFADSACTQELSSIIDPKKPHDFTKEDPAEKYLAEAANCASAAGYYTCCSYCGLSSEGTDAEKIFHSGSKNPDRHMGETYVSGKKAATCQQEGYTGDVCCLGCKVVLIPGEVIPAGHDLEEVPEVPATHHAAGTAGHYKCSTCGKLFRDSTASDEVAADALILPVIPHDFGDTYERDENRHWKECSCGDITDEGEHKYGSWETVKKPTKTEKGSKQRSCKICGYTQTGTIPPTSTPVTGDVSHIGFWMLLMVFSALSLVLLLAMPPKKGKYQR